MNLTEFICQDLIFPGISAANKNEALEFMAKEIARWNPDIGEQEIVSVIMERERLSSTGIGSGIAIPHAKLPGCSNHIVAFARSPVGIAFDAIDQKPVHLIFMLIGPVGANEVHLKVLSRISKFLHDTHFRENLLAAEDGADMMQIIAEKDAQF